ncbi:MAG: nicotinate-nucleotide adenylyltransferase [Lachnospiraceae bacterium]|nr:nicotinate-nucleotide adenylyltransferase [Lachnospiraceae bacterium]
MARIGILGGTFNPIHHTHIDLARAAASYASLTALILMPSGVSYLKDPHEIASKEDRYQMALLAAKNLPGAMVSRMELDRKGNSYTYETMETLRLQYPGDDLYLIMGADNLFSIEHWYRPKRIFAACHLLVAVRDDKDEADILQKADDLQRRFKAQIEPFPFQASSLSSTMIRERIAANLPITDMVPANVAQYIREHQLYYDKTNCKTT